MKLKFSKVANITVSFSWVFMIIIGSVFLMLAYNIIAKYKVNEDIKYDIELKQTLRNILNSFGRTAGMEENTLAPIGNIFRDSRVEILCNDGIPILSIDDKLDSNNDYLKRYPTFMTIIDEGKVDATFMAVESYRMPFKITNMLAIVSKKNLIVIDEDSDFGEKLFTKFRRGSYNELNYISYDFASYTGFNNFNSLYLKDRSISSVVFVTDKKKNFDIDMTEFAGSYDEVYLLEVEEDLDLRTGVLYYTDNKNVEVNFEYFDFDESLSLQTMAVFSRPETFACSYGLLYDSMDKVYDFYRAKVEHFANYDSLICVDSISVSVQSYYYDEFYGILDKIEVEIADKIKNIQVDSFKNAEKLKLLLDELSASHLIIEENNCQYVY